MNLFIKMLLAAVIVIVAAVVYRKCRKYAKCRQLERARQAALQSHVTWAQKIMAAETDEMIVSILRPKPIEGLGRIRFPDIVIVASNKVENAKTRLWRKDQRRKVCNQFESARALEQLADRMGAYLAIEFRFLDEGAELDEMKAVVAEDAEEHATNLLESARAGYRRYFVDLVDFTAVSSYGMTPCSYEKLTGGAYQVSQDWDELVVRYYKTPTLSDFRHDYDVSMRGSLRLLAVRALDEESLLFAQVVLAHFDSRTDGSDLWRQEVGVNLMTDLGEMVHRLQTERKPVFA